MESKKINSFMVRLSLKKDFSNNVTEKIIDFPDIGKVTMHDVSMERGDDLRNFYEKNYSYRYKPGYILGNEKLFNWMFKNNGGRVSVFSVDNKIIAHQGHVPVIFTDGEKDYKGFISASTMVDEDYRRKGLMSYLRQNVQDRYDMAVSLGGSAQGVALYSSMGYKNYGDLTRLIAIINPDKCEGISQNTNNLKKTVEISSDKNSNVREILRFEDIKNEFEDLWNTIFPPKTYFGVKRDFEFMDWRYSEHPIFGYKRFGLWKNDKLEAVIVYRKQHIDSANTNILHVTELIGEDEAIRELVSLTILSNKESKDVGWAHWFCSNKKINEALKPLGFMTPEELEPSVIPIFTNPIDYYKAKYPFMFWSKDEGMHKQVPLIDKWYITKGDGDADRPA